MKVNSLLITEMRCVFLHLGPVIMERTVP